MLRRAPTFIFIAFLGMAGVLRAEDRSGLSCDVVGKDALMLCDALRGALSRRAFPDRVELVLTARSPRPETLRARLDIIRDGRTARGEEAELAVMDRAAPTRAGIELFARNLLDRAGLVPEEGR